MNSKQVKNPEEGFQVVYNAWDIWNIAADATKRASEVKAANTDAITADTVSAIIISATAAEAFSSQTSLLQTR
jgi:hypothetical protein